MAYDKNDEDEEQASQIDEIKSYNYHVYSPPFAVHTPRSKKPLDPAQATDH